MPSYTINGKTYTYSVPKSNAPKTTPKINVKTPSPIDTSKPFTYTGRSSGSSQSSGSSSTPTKKEVTKTPSKEELKKSYGDFAPSNIITTKEGKKVYTSVAGQRFDTPAEAAAANVIIKAPQAFNKTSSVYNTEQARAARQFVTEVKTGKPEGYYLDPRTGNQFSVMAGKAPDNFVFVGRPGSLSIKELQQLESSAKTDLRIQKTKQIQQSKQNLQNLLFTPLTQEEKLQKAKDAVKTAALIQSQKDLLTPKTSPDIKKSFGKDQKNFFVSTVTSPKIREEVIGLEKSKFEAEKESGKFFDITPDIKTKQQLESKQRLNVKLKSGQDYFGKIVLESKIDMFNLKYGDKELSDKELEQAKKEEAELQKEINEFNKSREKREAFAIDLKEASAETKFVFGAKQSAKKYVGTPAQKYFTTAPNEFFSNLGGLSGVLSEQEKVVGFEPSSRFFGTTFTEGVSHSISQKPVKQNFFDTIDLEKTIEQPKEFGDLTGFRSEFGARLGKIEATRPLTEQEQFQDLVDVGVSTGIGAGAGFLTGLPVAGVGAVPGTIIGGLSGLAGGLTGVAVKEDVRSRTGSFELGYSAGLAADIVTDIGVGAAGFKLFEFATTPILKSSKFVGSEKVFSVDADNFVLTSKGVVSRKYSNRFRDFFDMTPRVQSNFVEGAFDVSKKTTIPRKILNIESVGLKDLSVGQEFQVYKQFSRGQGVPRVLKGNLEGLEGFLPESRFEDLLRTRFDVAGGLKSADTFDVSGFVTTKQARVGGLSDTRVVKNIQTVSGRKAPRVGIAPLGFEDTKLNISSRLTGFGDEIGEGISKGSVRGKFRIIDEDLSGGFTKQFKQGISEARIVKGELVTDASKKSVFDFGRVKVLPKDYGKGLGTVDAFVESKSGVSKTLLKTSKKTSAKKTSKSVSKTLGQTRFDSGKIFSSVVDEGTEQVLNFGKFASGFVIYPGVKSISGSVTGTKDFFRIKGVEDFKSSIKTGLGLDSKLLNLQDTGIKTDVSIKTDTSVETKPITSTSSLTGLDSATKVKTDTKTKTVTKLDTKLKTDFLLKLGDLNIPKPKIPIPPPILFPDFEEKVYFDVVKKKTQPAYSVYVRRSTNPKQGIKKVLVGSGLPKNLALTKGLRTADNYTDRTVILKQKGTTTRRDVPKPSFLLKKFREPKSKKLKSKGRLVFVEKSKHAIDSVNEKLGIPFKAQKQRRKKKLIGKLNIKL